LRIKKKISAAITPTPKMTPMATPAFAPPVIPSEVVVPRAVDEADAAESLLDPVEVAVSKSLTSWEDPEVDDAEVTKEVVVIGASDSLVVVVAFLVSVVSALVS
jgi:hypothetical protein